MSDFSTRIVSDDHAGGGNKVVVLDVGGHSKIHIPLDDWMELSAVKYAAEQLSRGQDPAEAAPGPAMVAAVELAEEQQALPHRH
jgi:hypothetical protein